MRNKTLRFLAGVVGIVLALVTVTLLAGLSADLGVTVAVGSVVGNLGEKTTTADHKVRDVSDALSVLEPSRFPFDTMLRRLKGRRRRAKNIKVEWAQTDRIPRTDEIAAASVAGTAGNAQTITITAPGNWRVDDIFTVPGAAGHPVLIVESINSGAGTMSVRALTSTGFGTVPAFAIGDGLSRLGNSKTENFAPSASRIMQPEYDHNLIHAFDAVVRVSDHRKHTANYTNTNDWKRARVDNLYDLRKSLEYNYLWGQKSETQDSGSSEWRWTMNGVTRYITKSIGYTIGALTEAQLIDIMAEIFTGNNGAFTRMLFADSVLCGDLDKVLLAKMQHAPTRKIAGVEFSELKTRFGRLLVAYHPGFDELGFSSYGVVLDMNNVVKRELASLEKRTLELKKSGVADADAEQYTEKSSVEITKYDTHAIITGS